MATVVQALDILITAGRPPRGVPQDIILKLRHSNSAARELDVYVLLIPTPPEMAIYSAQMIEEEVGFLSLYIISSGLGFAPTCLALKPTIPNLHIIPLTHPLTHPLTPACFDPRLVSLQNRNPIEQTKTDWYRVIVRDYLPDFGHFTCTQSVPCMQHTYVAICWLGNNTGSDYFSIH